jgi:hypothetical protein
MKVSRREFVNTAGWAAAAGYCALPSFGFIVADRSTMASAGCTLLDLKANCALHESFAGMRAALGDGHGLVPEHEFASREFASSRVLPSDRGHVVIVAGAGAVEWETFSIVADLLRKGARVVWESGAAFLEHRDFAKQRALTHEYFGISMERPVDVWSQAVAGKSTHTRSGYEANRNVRTVRAIGHQQVPYAAYRWPREVHVRDFSRVIPVSAANGLSIAHWGELSVAWREPVGPGTLVFLGSPIGPALRAGDSEACSLFHSIIAS